MVGALTSFATMMKKLEGNRDCQAVAFALLYSVGGTAPDFALCWLTGQSRWL